MENIAKIKFAVEVVCTCKAVIAILNPPEINPETNAQKINISIRFLERR